MSERERIIRILEEFDIDPRDRKAGLPGDLHEQIANAILDDSSKHYGVVRTFDEYGVAPLTTFNYPKDFAEDIRNRYEAAEGEDGPMFNFRVARLTILEVES